VEHDFGHLGRAPGERMQAELTGCIGCGCLSQTRCAVVNSDDRLRTDGSGPRRVLGPSGYEP
jgi:MerR family redox-sensitive transcriptional activator SoxR